MDDGGPALRVLCGACERSLGKVRLAPQPDGPTRLESLWFDGKIYTDDGIVERREQKAHRRPVPIGQRSAAKPQYSQAWECKCGKRHRATVKRLTMKYRRAVMAGARSIVLEV